jgi:holliday junction DNA helicase RuvB
MDDKTPSKRHISPSKKREDGRLDGLMRPQLLADFTGQERLKANLSILIEAAKGGRSR